ncbi:conserved hypothetical protein [Histoplasma mississippiense (nom. inval.)]|uniref:conserved hypothetical protein n=1 Tax=Ajellomyces capsulatus (strain NAm1 / WU24) TaxID=2059318 RepID=UPI000157B889|nr:conserved hypothetical protein [Histoplasma mississippiense (nom. inval.)]EDN03735.1 conserved hypothetical protein [Histoplasma mississippiense (nom. inval.)]
MDEATMRYVEIRCQYASARTGKGPHMTGEGLARELEASNSREREVGVVWADVGVEVGKLKLTCAGAGVGAALCPRFPKNQANMYYTQLLQQQQPLGILPIMPLATAGVDRSFFFLHESKPGMKATLYIVNQTLRSPGRCGRKIAQVQNRYEPVIWYQELCSETDARFRNHKYVKLAALNAELSSYQSRMAKMRDGPGKNAIRQKALKVLQRRKQYEAQRDQLSQQSWNMEQAGMMQDNLKNVMTTVDAMKTTTKTLKQQYGKVDIDQIERMQDEMQDLMEIGNEIQESISRAYDVPEDVDEAELDAELEALGEESMFENALSEDATPAFLQDEVAPPQFVDEPPEEGKVKEAAG